MRTLIPILFSIHLLFASAAFAKNPLCAFYDHFGENLMQAKKNAANLPETQRGSFRALKDSKHWQQADLDSTVSKLYGDAPNVKMQTTKTGKVVITPENMVEGKKYREIIFDADGCYFRIQEVFLKNGKVATPNNYLSQYLDLNGNPIPLPKEAGNPEIKKIFENDWAKKTHFKAGSCP